MRTATIIALVLLLLPAAVWGQAPAAPAAGHFADWPANARWGADKQTFDVRYGIRNVEATFTVSQNGFGWHRTFTDMKETFDSWANVTAWCSALPGTVALRTQSGAPRFVVNGLEPEALATIVDGYFKKYVPAAEWSGPEFRCTLQRLSGPHPAAASKVRELLEAASAEKR